MVKILPSNTADVGSIPAPGVKISHVLWPKQNKTNQNEKQKQYCNKSIIEFKINKYCYNCPQGPRELADCSGQSTLSQMLNWPLLCLPQEEEPLRAGAVASAQFTWSKSCPVFFPGPLQKGVPHSPGTGSRHSSNPRLCLLALSFCRKQSHHPGNQTHSVSK